MFIDMINNKKELVTISEATKIAHVSRRSIYNWIQNNRIDYTRVASGSIRIVKDSLFKLNDERNPKNYNFIG